MPEQSNQRTAKGAMIAKPPLLLVYIIQFVALLLVSGGFIALDSVIAYSVCLGGIIAVVPNAYFASLAFRYRGAKAARHISRSFYRGEAGKFLLTALFFASVFILVRPLDSVALFLAYVTALAFNWGLMFYRLR